MILNPFIPLVDCRGVVKVNRAFVIRCQVKVINTKISIILPRISYSIIFDFYFVIIEFFSLQNIFKEIVYNYSLFFSILLVIFFPALQIKLRDFFDTVELVNKAWSRCQLISKCPFGVIVWTPVLYNWGLDQNTNKKIWQILP